MTPKHERQQVREFYSTLSRPVRVAKEARLVSKAKIVTIAIIPASSYAWAFCLF